MTSVASTTGQTSPPQSSTPLIANPASPPSKRDLKSWWKGFKLPSKHQDNHEPRPQGIFGVPLRQSITYANVAISLIDENGQSYIYGYVPIVVAKCGVFLKEKATSIEGIFRLSGSEKRIKELKTIFDSPDRYGKGLSWEGYTVHDAANVLRRYLNDLPEPVVPLDLYEKFRDPLRGATKQAVGDAEGPQFVENFDEAAAIDRYQKLITELPPLNRQLLLYILDLLAVFAAKSDENRMNSQNLAAIFQPGMLSHPSHAMAPEEYRLNQCVIIFLIENQDHFLIGMQGTAADENTKKEIESGTPSAPVTPNVNRKTGGIDRSASNASAGAESVRLHGQLRRNRSVSSRNSRQDGSTTPNSPAVTSTPTTGGLGRSNTVPSKKSPALVGGRFQRHEHAGPNSPSRLEPLTQVRTPEAVAAANRAEQISLGPGAVGASSTAHESISTPARSQERLLEVPHEATTPSKDRSLPGIFNRSPDSVDKRTPNKLKKKRGPGSLNPSAHSSNASLPHGPANAVSPANEIGNPMEGLQSEHEHHQYVDHQYGRLDEVPEQRQAEFSQDHQLSPPTAQASDVSSDATPRASQIHPTNISHAENTLKAKKSPSTSLNSSFNEGSDMEHGIDEMSINTYDTNEKKRRWRLSRTKKDDNGSTYSPGVTSPRLFIGSNDNADVSTSSIGSSSRPRRSFNEEGFDASIFNNYEHHERDESRGPIGWIRTKYREAKESAERRTKSPPPADRPSISSSIMSRRRSQEMRQSVPDKHMSMSSQTTPAPTQVPNAAAVSTTVPVAEQQRKTSGERVSTEAAPQTPMRAESEKGVQSPETSSPQQATQSPKAQPEVIKFETPTQ